MNHIWSIAQKELRGYFRSALALIFLAIFLSVTIFSFFWVEKFFVRGLVDVRPMFEWLPILLILLVSALSMRMWSEEQKSGTLELLLTLPVPLYKLVLGKFLAGLLLIAVALALTLPLPISVSMMGDLDWGPVIGGYLAALLLASTYLSIGLSVSSTTDNQIVALFGTGLVCGIFYLLGLDVLTQDFNLELATFIQQFGTGSRFESVARGVLDVRDLAYYFGMSAFFVVLNIVLLQAKSWSQGLRSRHSRQQATLATCLVAANIVLLNVWLSPLHRTRVDLTEDGIYSLSPVSRELVASLQEPLLIRGYFSSNIHPKLDPLVPEIRDFLAEYNVAGSGNIIVEWVNPDDNTQIEKEAEESYNITPDQFPITTRKKQAIVKAYFRILIEYGDKHEVLSFNQLITILPVDTGDVEVKLGNLEYEITKSIKKVVYGFQNLDAVFAALGKPVELIAYVSDDIAGNLKTGLETFRKAANQFVESSKGRMSFATKNPSTTKEQRELYRKYGIEPFRSLVATDKGMKIKGSYYHFLLKVGKRSVLVSPPEKMTEIAAHDTIEAALKQVMPGFIKTIGLVLPPTPPAPNPQLQQRGAPQPRPSQSFRLLESQLKTQHQVQRINLQSGRVADSIDILLLAGPEELGESQLKAIDQFLMRGGSVIALVGQHRLDLQSPALQSKQISSDLNSLLQSYGVEVSDKLVFDKRSDLFIKVDPVNRRAEPQAMPHVLRIEREGLHKHLATTDLPGLLVPYASPLTVSKPVFPTSQNDSLDQEKEDAPTQRVEVLAQSSAESWLASASDLSAGRLEPPKNEPPKDKEKAEKSSKDDDTKGTSEKPPKESAVPATKPILAVAITGTFPSHFAKKDADKEKADQAPSADERLLTRSPPDARLVVIGSSSLVADTPIDLATQLVRAGGSRLYQHNIPLIMNLVDWGVEETDLLQIRARSANSRLLQIEKNEQSSFEYANYAIAVLLIIGIYIATLLRRQGLQPIDLPRSQDDHASNPANKEAKDSVEDAA